MRKYLLFVIPIVFLIAIASAEQQSLGVFKVGSCITLIQTCSNCTYNNISSVIYPNSTQVLGQMAMTKVGTKFNYSNFCLPSDVVGQYIVNGFGDVDGVVTVWAYNFEASQTGTILSIAQGIIYIIFLVAASIIFGLVFYGGLRIKWKNSRDIEGKVININDLKYAKIFLLSMSYLLLMFIFGILRSISANFLSFDNVSSFFNLLFWFMFSALWPLIVLTFLFTVIMYVSDNKLKRKLMRGIPVR